MFSIGRGFYFFGETNELSSSGKREFELGLASKIKEFGSEIDDLLGNIYCFLF